MDEAGAYDTVSHRRLIHNLRKRKIPKWITDWVDSFLNERSTTLAIHSRVTDIFEVRTGIPQGSPISPILYLFYNADLLDICERPGTNTSAIGFVDDINVLAYGKSTEENCKTLEEIHKKCERWAIRHGSVFAPKKYELIHLSRNPKKFNMTAVVKIENSIIKPKTDIRILGLRIDTKLKWGPHIRKIQEKLTKQSRALTKISTSTWGATFPKARQIYTAVVRPAITYGSTIWHMPKDIKKSNGISNKLAVIQNKCLRTIAGAFKATPIAVLEAETYIAPIDIHLDQLQTQARHRLCQGGQKKFIINACNSIANKLRGRAGRKRAPASTPGMLKHAWAKKIISDTHKIASPVAHPPWAEPPPNTAREIEEARAAQGKITAKIKKRYIDAWQTSWKTYQNRTSTPTPAQAAPLTKKRIKLHKTLAKAESALTIQIRSEKIGLADFLFRRHVPDVLTPNCPCGWPKQTAKHVIMFCKLNSNRQSMLRSIDTNNYRLITDSSRAMKLLTAWLMKTGLLTQFSMTAQHLYH